MGHSSIHVRFDTYGNLSPSPDDELAAVQQLEAQRVRPQEAAKSSLAGAGLPSCRAGLESAEERRSTIHATCVLGKIG
jgi:hypothetical protein